MASAKMAAEPVPLIIILLFQPFVRGQFLDMGGPFLFWPAGPGSSLLAGGCVGRRGGGVGKVRPAGLGRWWGDGRGGREGGNGGRGEEGKGGGREGTSFFWLAQYSFTK